MIRPKMLGEVQTLTKSAQTSDFFSSKYSLKKKAGGNDGLVIGQEIYCLPLVKDGIYEMVVHQVKARGQKGFKSKFNTFIPCKCVGDDVTPTCCQLAQEEWDKFVANGKKGETVLSFKTSRFYIPVLLLGNDTGSKTASNIPVSKLTMSGRDFSFIELSQKAFKELIETFKNDLLNNGRMEYGLEGVDLYNNIMLQLQKHILKISINKPDGFGTHKKHYSFVSFENKNIGAETGSYKNITEGLAASKKLQGEVEEFLTLFSNECEGMLTPWTDVELINYVNGSASISNELEQQVATSGVVPSAQKATLPKSEQVVIEEDITLDEDVPTMEDGDEDLFDASFDDGITLDDEPATPTASASVSIPDEDMSFDMDEDFFGEE